MKERKRKEKGRKRNKRKEAFVCLGGKGRKKREEKLVDIRAFLSNLFNFRNINTLTKKKTFIQSL